MPNNRKDITLEVPECSKIDFIPLTRYLSSRRKIFRDMKLKSIKICLTFKDGVCHDSYFLMVKVENIDYELIIMKYCGRIYMTNNFSFNLYDKKNESSKFININKQEALQPLYEIIIKMNDILEVYKGLAYRMLF